MDNYQKIYWLTTIDSIRSLVGIILTISIMILIGVYARRLYILVEEDEDLKLYITKSKCLKNRSSIVVVLCSLFLTFMPTKTEMIIIYAGGATMDYVEKDKNLQNLPYQTTKLISDYLDKSIKSISETKKEESKDEK